MTHEKVPVERKLEFMGLPGVISVGEGVRNGADALIITVDRTSDLDAHDFPADVHGVAVYVEFGDPVEPERRAIPDSLEAAQTGRHRPVQPGTSTENEDIPVAGGTIGPLMEDNSGNLYLTSNWHVWDDFEAQSGDRIWQPMGIDGGGSGDLVARFEDGAHPENDGIDFSYAIPEDDVAVSAEVRNVGVQQGSRTPQVGDPVVKSGRTTGVTYGVVDQVNVLVGQSGTGLTLAGQVRCSYDSDGGDSGSPVLHRDTNEVMGIHWGSGGIGSPIDQIESWMGAHAVNGEVSQPNMDPIAQLRSVSRDELTVTVDARDSYDPDGSIVSYEWDFDYVGGLDVDRTGPTASFTYDSDGTYTIALRVTDNEGAEDFLTHDVTVEGPTNRPPVAGFNVEIDGMKAKFTPTTSDPDGNIVSHEVEWGDGHLSTGSGGPAYKEHIYNSGGTYTITLYVEDAEGLSDTASETVTVTEPDPCATVDCDFGEECVDGACEVCMYDGHPRRDYGYDGSAVSTFESWQDCQLSTDEFQRFTPKGHGTAALIPPDGGGNGDGDGDRGINPRILAGIALLGLGVIYTSERE